VAQPTAKHRVSVCMSKFHTTTVRGLEAKFQRHLADTPSMAFERIRVFMMASL